MIMRVTVKYFNLIKNVTDCTEETICLSNNSNIEDLLNKIIAQYGEGIRNYLIRNNQIRPHLKIYVKNKNIFINDNLDYGLNDKDIVYIMIAPTGG